MKAATPAPNRIPVDFRLIDGYLLGDSISKAKVVEAFLGDRAPDPLAAPFYRALEAVGVRAADEAFIALRLILAGQPSSDERVRRLRALSATARAAAAGDPKTLKAVRKRDPAALADVAEGDDLAAVGKSARAAYRRELEAG